MLTNWGVPGVSQATLASEMGTTAIGFTLPLAIPLALNRHINAYYGQNVRWTTVHRENNDALLDRSIFALLNVGSTLVITVYSSRIWWPNASRFEAHYLVIYGIHPNWQGHGWTYLVWDPAPGGGTHHLAASDWERVAYDKWVVDLNITL